MRISRLARMSLPEIADRGRQKTAQWVDRVTPRFVKGAAPPGLALPPDRAAVAALELFRHAAPRRFFAGVEKGDAVDVLREEVPAACREIVASANQVFSRRFDLLGYEGLSFGDSVDWHLDPVSRRRAPMKHWSRLDPLDAASVGDSKVIWELNRHQWLLPLAQAYWLTADQRYADEALDLVDDWCRANPYGIGINWASSLEVAFRLMSWSWAFVLIRDAGALSEREFAGLLSRIRVHASHVERYLSRYFSPNTHLTGEALGLFYASVLFPELREAARWRRISVQILIDECRRQVRDDGVYFEQATCYQRYTIEIYLQFLALAGRNDVNVPADVRQKVERMVEFLMAICGPDGTLPQIGDADGGWLTPLSRRGPADCRGTFATAAAFFGRGDFLFAAGGPAPEVLWLFGTAGWERLKTLHSQPPHQSPSAVFRQGGYAIMRSGWGKDAHQLILDVGPLGCDVSGAHGHADLLSVNVSTFGEPYIVDPGTFCYTADPDWRDHFRGSAAHSTLLVDKTPQVHPAGPFAWQSRPAGTLRSWRSSEGEDFVDAFHDAYSGLRDPVSHRRRILFVKPRYWVIVDDLTGRAQHEVEVRFQCAPRRVEERGHGWVAMHGRRGDGLWVGAFCREALTSSVVEGTTNPPEGWVSPNYGQRRPAPLVRYQVRTQLPLRIVTLMVPVERLVARPPKVTAVHDNAGQLTGLRFDDSGETVRFDDDSIRVEVGQAPLRTVDPVGSTS